ncbi:MAG TPA: PmoA family protein [Candidatus Dormibacteraeota bacterium]|jgi:hypothetical protein|nr:PmoA family protein [Candidatus Dormibacteraeota bacterium]
MQASLTRLEDGDLEYRCGNTALFRYVTAPPEPLMESPKSHFHPLRTLAGDVVTIHRPWDHAWHHGLSMTASQLSGQNFWGGPTYLRDRGYAQLDNNGSILHRDWEEQAGTPERPVLRERLEWVASTGSVWIDELRTIAVTEVDINEGWWALRLGFSLRNVTDSTLTFGSPTTAGRPAAGYGGLFWRGPRSFLGGHIRAEGGLDGPDVMGRRARWLAFTGHHDETMGVSTLVFADTPSNPRYPNKWFVRNQPYACASCAFMFDEEYDLAAGVELRLEYDVIIAAGEWEGDAVESGLGRLRG